MSERTHVSRRPCSLFKYAQLKSLNNISYILWSISNNALKTKGRPSIQHDTFYLPFWLGFVSVLHIYLLHLLSSRNKASLKFFVINLLKIICVDIYLFGHDYFIRYCSPPLIHPLFPYSPSPPPPPPPSSLPSRQIVSSTFFSYASSNHVHVKLVSSFQTQAPAYELANCQLSWDSPWLLDSSSFCFCLDITTT